MTPLIVATHDDGVVRIYVRQPDGDLLQTGRFVALAIDPPALADLVADLTDLLQWNGSPEPKPVTQPIPALPKAPKAAKADHRKLRRAGPAEMQARRDAMLAWLTVNDGATASQAASATTFGNRKDTDGAARKLLDQLVDRGLATKDISPWRNGPHAYHPIPPTTDT